MSNGTSRRPPSIKDVAALAKVSVPTVSRYLNTRDRVSEEKQRAIAKAIDLLGYRPNPIARALVSERTTSVAVLSTNTTLYGQSQTIRGIERSAREAGYSLSIAVLTNGDRHTLQNSVRSCLDHNPAGVILLDFDEVSADAYAFLPSSLPTVLVAGNREPEATQISLGERESGYAITRHLLELGHRRVLHVAIPGGVGSYTRLEGWRRACEEAGAPVSTPIGTTWDAEDSRRLGRRLAEDPTLTAVFAGNDETAMGLIRGLTDGGLRVPEDVSVVGFDDHPIAKVWNPSLTTIRQDFEAAGMRAFALLEAQIGDVVAGRGRTGNWGRSVELPGELVVRESSAAPNPARLG